jgi:hypothetical protein
MIFLDLKLAFHLQSRGARLDPLSARIRIADRDCAHLFQRSDRLEPVLLAQGQFVTGQTADGRTARGYGQSLQMVLGGL